HLAKSLSRIGKLEEAEAEYAQWTGQFKNRIEHGYIDRLAQEVDAQLQKQKPNRFFVNAATLADPLVTKKTLMDDLESFLVGITHEWDQKEKQRIWGGGKDTRRKRFAALRRRHPELPAPQRG